MTRVALSILAATPLASPSPEPGIRNGAGLVILVVLAGAFLLLLSRLRRR